MCSNVTVLFHDIDFCVSVYALRALVSLNDKGLWVAERGI